MKKNFKLLDEFELSYCVQPDELAIKRADLATALRRLSKGVAKRPVFPVLSGVLIEHRDGVVTLKVSNIETALRLNVSGVGPDCKYLIKFSVLQKFVRATHSEFVRFASHSGGGVTVRCGAASMTARGMEVEVFPRISDEEIYEAIEISDGAELIADIAKAAKFASKDDSRRSLRCVLIETDEQVNHNYALRVTVTDGKRLFTRRAGCVSNTHLERPVLVGIESIPALTAFFAGARGGFSIIVTNARMMIANERCVASLKIYDDNYPNYRRVIPNSFLHEIKIQSFLLRWGVATFGRIRSCHVKLKVYKNTLKLSLIDGYEGIEFETSIPVDTGDVQPGESMVLDGAFLADAILAGENIVMRWKNDREPVELVSGNTQYVIMTIRER